ncbi:MAG TPA: DUF4398 domain-containing protein [Polyangiaceae bacterium]
MRLLTALILASTGFIVACGGGPKPQAQASQSQAAISAAEAVGAQNFPKAALHLKMARDQVKTAELLMADGDNDEANLVLQRAEADAELALALAREEKVRAEAREELKKVDELREK